MKKLILLTIVLIVVVIIFVFVRSQKNLINLEQTFIISSVSPTPTVTPPFNTHVIPLTIKNNKLIKGPAQIQVNKDQMVVLQITSDSDDELSILGYDKRVFLQRGKMVVLSFLSTITGDFSYELESAKKVLGNIQVGE